MFKKERKGAVNVKQKFQNKIMTIRTALMLVSD